MFLNGITESLLWPPQPVTSPMTPTVARPTSLKILTLHTRKIILNFEKIQPPGSIKF